MATMFEICNNDANEAYRDEASGEIYDGASLWDILHHADMDGYRYTTDADDNIIEMIPREGYSPADDLPLNELDLSDDERQSIMDGEMDDERLAELEEESGLWEDPEKFQSEIVIEHLGTVFDYLKQQAMETFTEDDYLTEDDIDNLGGDTLMVDLTEEEYDDIAMAATGHHINEA